MGLERQQRDQPGDGQSHREYQTFHLVTFLSAADAASPELAVINSAALAADRRSAASRDPMAQLPGAAAAAAS